MPAARERRQATLQRDRAALEYVETALCRRGHHLLGEASLPDARLPEQADAAAFTLRRVIEGAPEALQLSLATDQSHGHMVSGATAGRG
jgi:hypothetical protein